METEKSDKSEDRSTHESIVLICRRGGGSRGFWATSDDGRLFAPIEMFLSCRSYCVDRPDWSTCTIPC